MNNSLNKQYPNNQINISVNDLIIKASAIALRSNLDINVSWQENEVIMHGNIDISVAVTIPGGLITPIIKNADIIGLLELSKRPELKSNESIVVLTFGQEDIEEEVPIGNNEITMILNRNTNLFWKPYLHNFEIFNIEMHLMLISTILCNTYGNLRVRLPMEVLIYIFKFFNRANFINY